MSGQRGRPREIVDPVRISVRISASDYDRVTSIAHEQGQSVPTVVRQGISALLNTPPPKLGDTPT